MKLKASLALQFLRRQRFLSLLSVLLIAFSVLVPLSLLSLTGSMEQSAYEKALEIYGEFTDVLISPASPEGDSSIRPPGLAQTQLLEEASFSVLNSAQSTKKEAINIGVLQQSAMRLGHLRFAAGRAPEKADEIAVEAAWLHKLGLSDQLNQNVTLQFSGEGEARTFRLCGILSNYSATWVKPNETENGRAVYPSGFVAQDMASVLRRNSEAVDITLLRTAEPLPIKTYKDLPGLLQNAPLRSIGQGSPAIPAFIYVLVALFSVVMIYSVLSFFVHKERKTLAVLRSLGMTRREAVQVLYVVLAMLCVVGLPLGIGAGLLLSKALIGGIAKQLALPLAYHLQLWTVAAAAAVGLGSALLAGLGQIGRIYRLSPVEVLLHNKVQTHHKADKGKKSQGKAAKSEKPQKPHKRSSSITFAFSDLFSGGKQFYSVIFLMALTLLLFNFFSIYLNVFETKYLGVQAEGRIMPTYDYEFLVDVNSAGKAVEEQGNTIIGPNMEGTTTASGFFSSKGATEAMFQKLKQDKTFEKVLGYKESGELRTRVPLKTLPLYLDAYNGILGDMGVSVMESDAYSPALSSHFGYSKEELLVPTQLSGYSDEELMGLREHLVEGDINLSALKAGEEVILMLPIMEEHRNYRDFISPKEYTGAANQRRDDTYHVGDVLDLTQLISGDANVGGLYSDEQAKAMLKRQDKQVKIGAILHQRVGWFDKPLYSFKPITLLTANQGFEALGYPSNYVRLSLFLGDNPSAQAQSIAQHYAEQLPNMELDNQVADMENYKEYQLLLRTFSNTVTVMLVCVCTLAFLSQLSFKTMAHRRDYALYRINGMCLKKLLRMLLLQNLALCSLAVLLAAPVILAVGQFYAINLSSFFDAFSMDEFLISILFAYAVSLLAALPSMRYLKKAPLVDVLKEE